MCFFLSDIENFLFYCVLGKAVQFSEPALLVGETGCGKTSVCQLLALLRGRSLLSVNCHMHTEAADFLGSLRPVRDHQVN
jgi:midasin